MLRHPSGSHSHMPPLTTAELEATEEYCEYMLNLLKEPYSSQVSNLSLLKVKHHHKALLSCHKNLALIMS